MIRHSSLGLTNPSKGSHLVELNSILDPIYLTSRTMGGSEIVKNIKISAVFLKKSKILS